MQETETEMEKFAKTETELKWKNSGK